MKPKYSPIQFTKMHGLGNDFAVIECLTQAVDIDSLPVQLLADRHRGIGFDQLLVIERGKQADFYCRIFNADGSEAEQCGNGLRCIARFLHESKLIAAKECCLETKAGLFPVCIEDYDHIHVTLNVSEMNVSLLEIALGPSFQSPIHSPLHVSTLSLGNPHAIVKVDTFNEGTITQLAPVIAAHASFPHGVNIGFMQVIDPAHIRLRTVERGSGETLACGSNACAAVIAGIANGWLSPCVKVEFRHGHLWIKQENPSSTLIMIGPAAKVFTGMWSETDS